MRTVRIALTLSLLIATPVAAQPSLDSLWPHEVGRRFTYDGTYEDIETPPMEFTGYLVFDGTGVMAPGVTVQNLIARIDGEPAGILTRVPAGLSPLLARVWIARADLRSSIGALARENLIGMWPSLLLGPAAIDTGVGHLQTATHIGLWRDAIADWSWWVLTDDLSVGASFTMQLVPDLATDVYLHGTVRGFEETVSTGAGTWSDAVIMDYVVDLGTQAFTDEGGNEIGTVVNELRGWVAFVPNVGPVASSETISVLLADCPLGCPEEEWVGEVISRTELSLRSTPVAVQAQNWGALKTGW